jgi:hypothetical protein
VGQFKKGQAPGPGRPKGMVSFEKRRLASAMREFFLAEGPMALQRIIRNRRNPSAAIRAIEVVLERGWGKAQVVVRLGGIEPGSPEAILLELAGQHIPLLGDGQDDEEG